MHIQQLGTYHCTSWSRLRAYKGHGARHHPLVVGECLVKSSYILSAIPSWQNKPPASVTHNTLSCALGALILSILHSLTLGPLATVGSISFTLFKEPYSEQEERIFALLYLVAHSTIYSLILFRPSRNRAGPQAHTHRALEQAGCFPFLMALTSFTADSLENSHVRTWRSRNKICIFPFCSMGM